MHPRWLRCSSLKYCPIFSVVAPCHRGASPASVRRRDLHHGLLGYQNTRARFPYVARADGNDEEDAYHITDASSQLRMTSASPIRLAAAGGSNESPIRGEVLPYPFNQLPIDCPRFLLLRLFL